MKLDRAKAESLSTVLRRLAIPYYQPDFTKEMAEVKIADYILDLAEFEVSDVSQAAARYRVSPGAEYFPKPHVLHKLASEIRSDRLQGDKYKPVKLEFGDSRPIKWWMQSKQLWKPHWRESEVPFGESIRDVIGGPLRSPIR